MNDYVSDWYVPDTPKNTISEKEFEEAMDEFFNFESDNDLPIKRNYDYEDNTIGNILIIGFVVIILTIVLCVCSQ